MSKTQRGTAFVSYPSPYLGSIITRILTSSLPDFAITETLPPNSESPLLQWSTYDEISHERTLANPKTTLASSYTIRKSLIRKHFLNRSIEAYIAKHPESCLKAMHAAPTTYNMEISFADELDEMWTDELWELGNQLDSGTSSWWILKPSMADRGMGIRLFNSKLGLSKILEDFETEGSEPDAGSDNNAETPESTDVVLSQLRHFVVQEYLGNPLLIDPRQSDPNSHEKNHAAIAEGRKFHLRAYCIASGALTLYLYPRILALFAPVPYTPPSDADPEADVDLTPHLTNTCLQGDNSEQNIRLLSELVGSQIFSDGEQSSGITPGLLSQEDVNDIIDQVADVLAETFRAALESPVHFQPLPNAFELFGVDLLVTHPATPTGKHKHLVHLLELNAEPAIEMTGPRLEWILEELFGSIARVCVRPFFTACDKEDNQSEQANGSPQGGDVQHRDNLRVCLDVHVRGRGSW